MITVTIQQRLNNTVHGSTFFFLRMWPRRPHVLLNSTRFALKENTVGPNSLCDCTSILMFQRSVNFKSKLSSRELFPKMKNKFIFTTMGCVLGLFFWKKLKTPKRHFEIISPLNFYPPKSCFWIVISIRI